VILIFIRQRKAVRGKALGYFLGTAVLLVIHFFVLTEMNIEFIHALMYGGLAVLLFPLVGRFGGAVILGLPLMIVDEWYQHVILFPHYTDFFEFNDIILDLLGAGLFISILSLLGVPLRSKLPPLVKRQELWLLVGIVIVIIGPLSTCVVVPYSEQACENTWFILNKLPEMEEFWYQHPTIGTTLHVLKPVEGIMAMFLLCFGYLAMDPISSLK
jgi:hypothetical protein